MKINRRTNLNNDRIVSMGFTGCATKTKAINPTVQEVKVVVSVRSEKRLEQELSNSARKLSSPGKDLILLILIMLISTIPFWQL